MPNRLASERNPYLLQHANNPVDWYPWGEEAFEKARREEKPIFLSIGYSTCHWCHVIEHESFENPEIAALMNEVCVNIKVDREERRQHRGEAHPGIVAPSPWARRPGENGAEEHGGAEARRGRSRKGRGVGPPALAPRYPAPIVDAGMRQLAETGWIHNRARLITASFLVKDLLIDWRLGERWFLEKLVDADPASNNGGWQWSASTGTDAQPFFRIFSPTSQGERFDPTGSYVRRWVPELRDLPNDVVHRPWEAPALAPRYPAPIVDHAARRILALKRFEEARSQRG